MSEKLTDWFEPSVKPSLHGVYQTRDGITGRTFQNWNGKYWGIWCGTPEMAAQWKRSKSSRQMPEWRGLAKKPGK